MDIHYIGPGASDSNGDYIGSVYFPWFWWDVSF